MNLSKENLRKFFTIIVILFLLSLITTARSKQSKETISPKSVFSFSTVVCTYKNIVNSSFVNGSISQNISSEKPLVLTFVGVVNGEVAELRYLERSVSIPIAKLRDDGEKYIFYDGNSDVHTALYTIYKKTGISTFVSNDGASPVSQFGMGTCVGDSYDTPR